MHSRYVYRGAPPPQRPAPGGTGHRLTAGAQVGSGGSRELRGRTERNSLEFSARAGSWQNESAFSHGSVTAAIGTSRSSRWGSPRPQVPQCDTTHGFVAAVNTILC